MPNGKYRVFVNIDSPSGFWGEYQVYRKRAILAQGKPVVTETMDFEAFKKKYFRFWNVEDLPSDNTFDKYQKAYFHEKTFDVDVTDGQLQHRLPGRELGVQRLGRGDLPRGQGGRRARSSSSTWRPSGGSTSTTTSSGSCIVPPAIRCSRPAKTAAAATWSSSATRCRTSTTTTRRSRRRSASRFAARPSPASTSR